MLGLNAFAALLASVSVVIVSFLAVRWRSVERPIVVEAPPEPDPEPMGSTEILSRAPNPEGYYPISVRQLAYILEHESLPLINTFTPYKGEIAGTDLHIAGDAISDHLDQLPADRTTPLVLYCLAGVSSAEAATKLAALGYTGVLELSGGMHAWQKAGYNLLDRR